MKVLVGKALYALLFVVGVPVLLVAWARATESIVPLSRVHSTTMGVPLVAAGIALLLAGMHALLVHGGGLPMNAFPPPRHVTRGAYAVFAHPIYVGFCVSVLGVALATGSASGLWLVLPSVCLACTALAWGYEHHDLSRRFGAAPSPWLSIPPATTATPTLGHRLAAYGRVLLPWGLVYEAIATLGVPPDAVSTAMRFEARLPVLEATEVVYASTYVVVLAVPALARTQRRLRSFCIDGLLAMTIIFPLYLALPLVAVPRPFAVTNALGQLLALERALDTPTCAFPSFHVVWALIAARAIGGPTAWLWAALVCVSCITTGMHTIADVFAGLNAFALIARAGAIWGIMRGFAERVANSWREWRVGPVRIINHGAYAAAGTFIALALMGVLAGPGAAPALLVIWACALLGSAAWAQWVEGASGLSRPFGFYGGMLGAVAGCLAASWMGKPLWLLLAATCVSGPWVQSMGRMRCLVQGCCHGAPASPGVGIRYLHPRSRVNRVPEFVGVPLHPTPLYSILWNALVALATGRLWLVHAHLYLIGGVYLFLTGVGRFVEESYRGEPQTPVFAGLRLYQWVAVATVLAGIAVTMFARSAPAPTPHFEPTVLLAALVGAVANFVALGVDFPNARWRLSRLA